MTTVAIVGWTLLIASWTVPRLIKDQKQKNFVSALLAALSTGVFIGALLSKHCI